MKFIYYHMLLFPTISIYIPMFLVIFFFLHITKSSHLLGPLGRHVRPLVYYWWLARDGEDHDVGGSHGVNLDLCHLENQLSGWMCGL